MGRDLELERAWRDRMRRYERSDLSIDQFCKQEGLVAHQLSWWRRELKRRDGEGGRANGKRKSKRAKSRKRNKQQDAASAKSFVPVQIAPSPQGGAAIEIVVDHRLRIAVRSGFDADVLSQVVRVLEDR